MSIEELIQQGSIHPFEATRGEIEKAMGIARRDLALAEKLLEENFDWCFSIAHNAVLQACRTCMFHSGYRPASAEAHKATFEFMEIVWESHSRSPFLILIGSGRNAIVPYTMMSG